MKIIKKGKLPERKPYWVDRKLTCINCGCEFKLEVSDEKELFGRLEPHISTRCPTCNNLVVVPSP